MRAARRAAAAALVAAAALAVAACTSDGPAPAEPRTQAPSPGAPSPHPPGQPPAGAVHLTASGDVGASGEADAVLRQVAELAPDAHLVLGDLSYGELPERRWCRFVTQRVGAVPVNLVTGNHDSGDGDGDIEEFAGCLPDRLPGAVGDYPRQYYVDAPDGAPLLRLVVISPDIRFPGGGWSYDDGARLEWTTAAVDDARDAGIPWVVVAMHKPCLSVGRYGCEPGADLQDALLDHDVDLVLSGHEHSYQRTHQLALGEGCETLAPGRYDGACVADRDGAFAQGAGTVLAVVGTGGTALRDVFPGDPEEGYFAAWSGADAEPTWGNLEITADERLLPATFRRAAGGRFTDHFTIAAAPRASG